MGGISVEANMAPKEGWSNDLETLFRLSIEHPYVAAALFLAFIVVLILMPGGVGPAWIRYRGARRTADQIRQADVNVLIGKLLAQSKQRPQQPRPPRATKGGKRR